MLILYWRWSVFWQTLDRQDWNFIFATKVASTKRLKRIHFTFHWAGWSCTIYKHLENIHGDETRKKLAMLRHSQQWWRPEGPSSSSESVYTFLHDLESRLCASISIFIFFHDLVLQFSSFWRTLDFGLFLFSYLKHFFSALDAWIVTQL